MRLKSPRTTVRRLPKRGHHDFDTVASILDASFVCHLGFVQDGQPYVIPTAFGRDGETLYVHGSAVSRTLKQLSTGIPICLTVTLLDGLVLARSGFHSSINYRSVVVLGNASPLTGEQKLHGLAVISDHILAGRWAEIRAPSRKELNATTVLKLPLTEASAKIRTGPPVDDEEDYAMPIWAGVVPLTLRAGVPEPDNRLPSGTPIPAYVKRLRTRR